MPLVFGEKQAFLVRSRDEAVARLKVLEVGASPRRHPYHARYALGGVYRSLGLDAGHILALTGLYVSAYRDVLDRLAHHDRPGISRLALACTSDPTLTDLGSAFHADRGELRNGAIDRYWLDRPKLGLGSATAAFGLAADDAPALRGLWELPLDALRRGFSTVAGGAADHRFGALLPAAIALGGERLRARGARAIHRDAASRYRDDCRSFAAHQATTDDRRWRSKPPLSRQGHLASTTAHALGIALPDARRRGDAADWLDEHGANLRFPQEDR